jgi:histidine triad (HIT) family protein
MDCIFCKIIAGELPSEKVYEDDKILAFHDINPAAPVHIIVVPKIHIESLHDANLDNIEYIMAICMKVPEIAVGLFEEGYRVVTNIGENGGQTVRHLHFHILGGRKLAYMG